VGTIERRRDLHGKDKRLLDRQRTLFQPGGECFAIQVLHHQEVDAVLAAGVVKACICAGG